MDGVDPYPISGRRTLRRERLSEQAYASLCGAIAGLTCHLADSGYHGHDNDGAIPFDVRSELRAIFRQPLRLASNPTKPVTSDDVAQTRRNVRELTKVG